MFASVYSVLRHYMPDIKILLHENRPPDLTNRAFKDKLYIMDIVCIFNLIQKGEKNEKYRKNNG